MSVAHGLGHEKRIFANVVPASVAASRLTGPVPAAPSAVNCVMAKPRPLPGLSLRLKSGPPARSSATCSSVVQL